MGRKVFISVLGTGFYGECRYVDKTIPFKSSETRFVQQASLEYIHAKGWTSGDTALIILTEKARTDNWDRQIKMRKNLITAKEEPYSGLQAIIEKMNLPFKTQDISIPDGKDESEMWKIFSSVFENLQDNDELYFDLTHSFRYLPMLILVLSNYAKFLKHVVVKHISYGNYEARDKETKEAPIVDLLPLSALQDWTFAAGQFLDSGNVKKLVDLSNQALKPILAKAKGTNLEATHLKRFVNILSEVIDERLFCRGIGIVKSEKLKQLKAELSETEKTIIEVLNPVFFKIKVSMELFDSNENVMNGFTAAKWCLDNGLYQQAATILHENIVTFICKEENIDWINANERLVVNIAFRVNDMPDESQWDLKLNPDATEEEKTERKLKIKKILCNDHFKKLVGVFKELNGIRNDFNHAGMRTNSRNAMKLKKDIDTRAEEVFHIVDISNDKSTNVPTSKFRSKLLINLSNHSSTNWDKKQCEAALAYGEIINLPFPDIDADKDECNIESLVDDYYNRILALNNDHEVTVHLMGEMTFTFALVSKLHDANIDCVASTSKRNVIEIEPGHKEVQFQFVRFRKYVV